MELPVKLLLSLISSHHVKDYQNALAFVNEVPFYFNADSLCQIAVNYVNMIKLLRENIRYVYICI